MGAVALKNLVRANRDSGGGRDSSRRRRTTRITFAFSSIQTNIVCAGHLTAMERNAIWWEPAYARTIMSGTERPLAPFFYRIHIARITGHRATPGYATPPSASPSTHLLNRDRWLQKILRQVRKQA